MYGPNINEMPKGRWVALFDVRIKYKGDGSFFVALFAVLALGVSLARVGGH